jgi:very-short-patch-repair endonuclease
MGGWKSNKLLSYWYRNYMHPTKAEASLETAVATLGEPYRTQHPFIALSHFADFALLDRKLTIEVDGDSHDRPDQKEKDLLHMIGLQALGWRTVRVTNEQALEDPAGTVLAALDHADTLEISPPDYQARLEDLRARYPKLVDDAAKKATRLAQRRLVQAAARKAEKDLRKRGVRRPAQKS